MKRLLLLATIAFFAASCNQKHCWNCTVTYKNSVQFPTDTSAAGSGIKIQQVCNKTSKEIRQYENDNNQKDDTSSVTYDCVKDYYK